MANKEKTRSHEAEFGVMQKAILAASAHAGNLVWLLAQQHNTSIVNVGTSE